MNKPEPPAPPDYTAAAEQTAEGNIALVEAQTQANRPTQVTPWGTSSWENDSGDWTQTISLSPEQQAALDDQMRVQAQRSGLASDMFGRVQDEFSPTMDWSQFHEYQTDLGTGDEARQQAIDEMYNQATSRLDPQWEQRAQQTESQLRNQGLRPGDEAYDTAMKNLEMARTDAYNQAMFGAIGQGGAEGSRVFGMNEASAAFGNTARQAQIAEEMQRRGFTLNEINAILTGQQVGMPSMPGFNTADRAQGADYSGAARDQYSASMDAFSAQQAQLDSLMNGAGSAAMMFSDVRLKKNIRRIGSYNGHNVYSYEYLWGEPGVGVLAHEVPLNCVSIHDSGYFMVDYRSL